MQNAYRRTSLLLLAGLLFVTQSAMAGDNDRGVAQETLMKIEIIVEGETATATLFDTPTGRDFASLLPLSLTLEDYDDIERISDLPRRLSTVQAPDGITPEAGDITYYAPWGNLAIFVEAGTGNYTGDLMRLGAVETGLPALQRPGPLHVTIERLPD